MIGKRFTAKLDCFWRVTLGQGKVCQARLGQVRLGWVKLGLVRFDYNMLVAFTGKINYLDRLGKVSLSQDRKVSLYYLEEVIDELAHGEDQLFNELWNFSDLLHDVGSPGGGLRTRL